MTVPVDLAGWLDWQQHTHSQVMDFDLARLRAVALRLGVLQFTVPVFIVGGTNGKGSTAHQLAALARSAFGSAGLYTSPHLLRYQERIRIDGAEIDEPALLAAFAAVEAARGVTALTYFEFGTLAALWIFRRQTVRSVVLEVGLGGRLDATNLIDAEVAVLCSVGLDHTEWLGKTRQAIGAEKAGIFRAGAAVVLATADMPQSVWDAAAGLGVRLQVAGADYGWKVAADGCWDYEDANGRLMGIAAPALHGRIQYRNAAAALAAVRATPQGRALDAERAGQALTAVRLPGRMQRVPGAVEWIFDVAHNGAAAVQLARELRRDDRGGRCLAVLGILGDKDVAAVVRALDGVVDHWILGGIAEPRGLSATALAERMPSVRGGRELAMDIAAACARAAALAKPGDRVLVCGSFHSVGPALAWHELYSNAEIRKLSR